MDEPLDPTVAATWARRRSGPPESRVTPKSRVLRLLLCLAALFPPRVRGYGRAAVLRLGGRRPVRLRTTWGTLVAPRSDHTFMKGVCDEPLETALLWRLIVPGTTFVDVGANRGWYTTMAARRVGSGGRVLSFEPDDRPRAQLLRNIEVNGFDDRVKVFPYALDAHDGEAQFVSEVESILSHLRPDTTDQPSTAVPVRSLSAVLSEEAPQPPISVVKIDVEGAEERVLGGLDRSRSLVDDAALLIEVAEAHLHRFGSSRDAVIERLDGHQAKWVCWRHGRLEDMQVACLDAGRNVLALPTARAPELERALMTR